MALPPSPISGDAGVVPPLGPMAGGAPETDAGNPDEGTENEVVATICRSPDGKFLLYAGDEPEAGEADQGAGMPPGGAGAPAGSEPPAPEAQTFDNPGELMRALMPLLDEGTKGAEDSFGKGFRREPDATASGPPMAG